MAARTRKTQAPASNDEGAAAFIPSRQSLIHSDTEDQNDQEVQEETTTPENPPMVTLPSTGRGRGNTPRPTSLRTPGRPTSAELAPGEAMVNITRGLDGSNLNTNQKTYIEGMMGNALSHVAKAYENKMSENMVAILAKLSEVQNSISTQISNVQQKQQELAANHAQQVKQIATLTSEGNQMQSAQQTESSLVRLNIKDIEKTVKEQWELVQQAFEDDDLHVGSQDSHTPRQGAPGIRASRPSCPEHGPKHPQTGATDSGPNQLSRATSGGGHTSNPPNWNIGTSTGAISRRVRRGQAPLTHTEDVRHNTDAVQVDMDVITLRDNVASRPSRDVTAASLPGTVPGGGASSDSAQATQSSPSADAVPPQEGTGGLGRTLQRNETGQIWTLPQANPAGQALTQTAASSELPRPQTDVPQTVSPATHSPEQVKNEKIKLRRRMPAETRKLQQTSTNLKKTQTSIPSVGLSELALINSIFFRHHSDFQTSTKKASLPSAPAPTRKPGAPLPGLAGGNISASSLRLTGRQGPNSLRQDG